MNYIGYVINAGITVLSLILFITIFLSYREYKKPKLLFISIVFLLFFIKGIILSFGLFIPEIAQLNSDMYLSGFDLVIIVILYVTSLKR